MATISSQDNSALVDQTVPQWKRELILRRRALVRTLPAGNSTVKLTRPSVVAAVRQAEQVTAVENVIGKQQRCVSAAVASNKGILDQERADFNPRGRISESSCTAAAATAGAGVAVVGNMRLVEHIADAGAELLINGVGVDNNSINLDSNSVKPCNKMGEETSTKKICSTARPVIDNSALLSENNNCGHTPDDVQSDSSEELEYGPGIVNKLRSKYLSMTLREHQKKGVRPSLVNLRRATSLENMLDSESLDAGKPQIKSQPRFVKKEDTSKTTSKPHKTSQHHQRYRGVSRGNDSMKRARSVEALYRNELKGNIIMNRGAFRYPAKSGLIDINRNSAPVIKPLGNEDIVIVENKNKNKKQPTENKAPPQVQKMRTSNAAPETELPPPDVVKTTMKIFEGSSNQKVYSNKTSSVGPKSNAKPVLPPKVNMEKVHQKPLNKSPPRRALAPSPELRPFSPPNRLLSPDNISTPPLSPPSPSSPIRKLKSPSPTIESKQALFMPKDTSESEHFVIQPVIPNGKASSAKICAEGESSEDDVGDGDSSVKTVPQTVLENIRKDGLSLQFSFNRSGNNATEKIKSYLPNAKNSVHNEQLSPLQSPAVFNEAPSVKIVSASNAPNFQQGPKQVGVIRPMVTTNKTPLQTSVTGRELEKNLINREKLNDQPKSKVLVKKKIDDMIEAINVKEKTNKSEKNVIPSKLRSTKSGDNSQNIMVFNFSNRKDPPPDYIADDGLNLAPKSKFKAGETGVLILGVPGESSTDDCGVGPPSPCNVTFEGANILINGRSNLRKQPKASKLHIAFDDTATTTFEYPSESSLLDDDEEENAHFVDGKASSPSGVPLAPPSGPTPGVPVPLGGSSLASYTPSKVHLGSEDFQLGVTRAAPASPAVDPISKVSDSGSTNNADLEEEEYLKPAEESETVAWSAETTADLLF